MEEINKAAASKHPQLATRDGKLTKDALLKVALRQYQENGYEATSLRKITEELGITVAATYYYFQSKDQLLVAAFRRNLERLHAAHDNVGQSLSEAERLWTFVQLHTRLQRGEDVAHRQPYTASLLLNSLPPDAAEPLAKIMRSIRDRLRNIIAEGIRAKAFEKVNTTATAYAIFGISHQLNIWYKPGGPLDLEKLSAMYADFALRIVGAQPVRNRVQLQKLTQAALEEADAAAASE